MPEFAEGFHGTDFRPNLWSIEVVSGPSDAMSLQAGSLVHEAYDYSGGDYITHELTSIPTFNKAPGEELQLTGSFTMEQLFPGDNYVYGQGGHIAIGLRSKTNQFEGATLDVSHDIRADDGPSNYYASIHTPAVSYYSLVPAFTYAPTPGQDVWHTERLSFEITIIDDYAGFWVYHPPGTPWPSEHYRFRYEDMTPAEDGFEVFARIRGTKGAQSRISLHNLLITAGSITDLPTLDIDSGIYTQLNTDTLEMTSQASCPDCFYSAILTSDLPAHDIAMIGNILNDLAVISSELPALTLNGFIEPVTYTFGINTSISKRFEMTGVATCPTCTPADPEQVNYCFYCESPAALTAISTTDSLAGGLRALEAGDLAFVVMEGALRVYLLQESPGAVSTPPDVLIPDVTPGDLWWDMQDLGLTEIETFEEFNIGVSDPRTLTHESDPLEERVVTIVADGVVSNDYQIVMTSATETKITKQTAGVDAVVSVRIAT